MKPVATVFTLAAAAFSFAATASAAASGDLKTAALAFVGGALAVIVAMIARRRDD